MKLYLIRHGETTGDVEGRYGGDYDDGLSFEGERQAAKLAATFADKHIDIIVASTLIRAKETAVYLAQVTGADVEFSSAIRERNSYGVITGMTKVEATKVYPELVEFVKERLNTITGAETYEDFAQRFIQGLEQIVATHKGQNVAVVTHGGPLRVLFRDILKLGELTHIGDCSFVELEVTENGYKLVRSNGITPAFTVSI